MINVNQITAKLATLPDQALQQYAMMNKNDPYIMSLALSESTRRQEIRNAAQGAQGGMQEPPKVVDQVVAGMSPQPAPQQMAPQGQPMPEDTGIGQLPAGEMEFAGGGILAFAEGDAIPGPKPQYGSGVAFGGSIENWRRMRQGKEPVYPPPAPVEMTDAERKEYERKKELGGMGMALEWLQKKFDVDANNARIIAEGTEKRLGLTPKDAAEARAQFAQTDPRRVIPEVPAENAGAETEASSEATSKTPPAAPEQPSFVPGPTGIDVGDTGLGALMSLEDYRKRYGMDVLDKEASGLEAQLKSAGQKEIEGKKSYLSGIKADIAELGKYGVDREAKLNKQLKELEGKEDKNVSMALLEAGLAMMAGTSQYAFENIGKGALVGTKAYKEGLDKIEAKRDILDERIANLMDIRRNEDRANKKEVRAAEAGVSEAESALAKSLYTNTKDILGMKRETANAAATAYGNDQIARAKISSDKQVADAQIKAGDRRVAAQLTSSEKIAAMPGKDERLYAALSDPKSAVSIGLSRYADAMGKDKNTATRDFVDFVTAATKNADPTNPPNMDTLLQQFLAAQQRLGQAKMTSSLPKGAQVTK